MPSIQCIDDKNRSFFLQNFRDSLCGLHNYIFVFLTKHILLLTKTKTKTSPEPEVKLRMGSVANCELFQRNKNFVVAPYNNWVPQFLVIYYYVKLNFIPEYLFNLCVALSEIRYVIMIMNVLYKTSFMIFVPLHIDGVKLLT